MIEENKTDIKYVLIFLGIIVIIVLLNINYFFSTETISEIKVAEKSELTDVKHPLFSEKK